MATATKNTKAPAKAKAKAKPAKVEREERNGVKAPGAGGLCAKAWAMFDKLGPSTTTQQAAEAATKAKLNPGNARTELLRWRKFHGHPKP